MYRSGRGRTVSDKVPSGNAAEMCVKASWPNQTGKGEMIPHARLGGNGFSVKSFSCVGKTKRFK